MNLSDDERREIARWAAACAERALPIFETAAPGDERPREAIAGVRDLASGALQRAPLRAHVRAALAAAREVGDPAAAAAARAAGGAASSVFLHAVVGPDQEKHVLAAAAYAALARDRASADDPAAADAELRWAMDHAPPAVRAVLRQLVPRGHGRGRLDALLHQLDAGLRG